MRFWKGRGLSLQARLLRAELVGDEREFRRLLDRNRRAGGRFGVMPAAFVLLMHRRFRGVQDLREVTQFVSRYNAIAPPEHRVPPREAEAVLRSNLGEEYLADLVDDETAADIMYSLLFMLAHELALTEEQLDGLVAAADELVTSVETDHPEPVPLVDLSRIRKGDGIAWRPSPRAGAPAQSGSTSTEAETHGRGQA
ncbi:hypothetical protein [Micromonospora sp. SL4-19]|uniref:hypothetical protein n=1 Tax=Micromonospora sp. SL4-19 TaxID=3399129 RepID=UPI003A4DC1C8